MFVGLRVVKTVIAIAVSITIARLLHLEPDHFAGIVSMLAVQPSVYRSLHHTLSHMASALLASALGITAVLTLGSGPLVIAAAALVVMALHVKLGRTASLALAVIVTVNTMGTADELTGGMAAYNQFLLVLVGMTVGTAVNAIRKPVHREREDVLLAKSETMLRVLFYYIQIDLRAGKMTPYKPDMRLQIEEVRSYIESGKAVSQLVREDRWLSRGEDPGAGELFQTYETMIERIRDLVKALQKADLSHPEAVRLIRVLGLLIRAQERTTERGRSIPLRYLLPVLKPAAVQDGRTGAEDIARLFPYYQAYEAMADYARELEASRRAVDARPAFRPAPVKRLGTALRSKLFDHPAG
ncbi:FUSC family protein [Paenibacillus chitinolyticus]|uniref:FUSC family protein n=1 Tax=Paenibacillus chitinolyticus TaxID=79263 RepID=UPI001C478326|nr:aromatic acid exporter family protein [Paenibacillus chitinolyticus]MBV6713597.1 hypothetical protein [Paenibacillus chitinolyticus]